MPVKSLRTASWLRVAVVAATLIPAIALAASPAQAARFLDTGLPGWVRLPLAGTEIGAALLFLWPRTAPTGALLLAGVLGVAAALHFFAGEPAFAPVVYAIAALLIREHDAATSPSGRRERSG